jgi:hypothetical protein
MMMTISCVNVFSPPTESTTRITEELLTVASKKTPTKGNKVTFCKFVPTKKTKLVCTTIGDEMINSVSLCISSLSMVHLNENPPLIIPNASLPPTDLADGVSEVMIDLDLVSGALTPCI